jgi:L-iditol 2-dehydrogenase
MKQGDTVLVLGSGVSGLLHIQLSKLHGVKRVIATDINERRLKAAESFGADGTIDASGEVSEELRELNDDRLADKVIICTGAPQASEQAMRCVDRGGTILFFAVPGPDTRIPFPATNFWRDEVSVMTSYGAAPRDLDESLKLIERNKIKVRDLITHRLSLAETGLGFKLVSEAKECLKVIIEPYR